MSTGLESSMKHLSISVVIPTYNRAHLIERALNSALSQIRDGDEIIVVDDGSNDNSEQVVKALSENIRYIKQENAGAGVARNKGIKEATKDLIAFLDSDDEWMENKLQIQRSLLEARDDILFTYSDFAITNKAGKEIRNCLPLWTNDNRPWKEILPGGIFYSQIAKLPEGVDDFEVHAGDIYKMLAKSCYILTTSLMVRRERAGEALCFAEDIPTYEDWVCFGRIARAGKGAFTNIETSWQHSHQGFRLTDADTLVTSVTRLKVLNRVWGKDPDFLAENSDYYQVLLQEQYKLRTASYISMGENHKAKESMKDMNDVPLHYKILASLPRLISLRLLGYRRFTRDYFLYFLKRR